MVCIAFLKLFMYLMSTDDGPEEIAKVPNAFKIIFYNFHPIHIETTSLVLEVFGGTVGYIWLNDSYLDFILEAFSKYKSEYSFKYRFEPLLHTLYNSDNLIMIVNILGFIRSILSSMLDKNKRNILKSELDQTLIENKSFDNILDIIKERVKSDEYTIADCTFETVQKKLMKFKDPLKSLEGKDSLSKFSRDKGKKEAPTPKSKNIMNQFKSGFGDAKK